jgi:NTP pyrophosphatase (non-canonical NTP hydrolase)
MNSGDFTERLRAFTQEREWGQFHTQDNLAKSISIESAELLELFQWGPTAKLESVKDELADVLTYCFLLADTIGVDPIELMAEKLSKSELKYPVDKARGVSTKYDQL